MIRRDICALLLATLFIVVVFAQPEESCTKEETPRSRSMIQFSARQEPQPAGQPAAQPAAQPMVQPMAQPVAQPMAQPLTQPLAQPAEQAMAQPVVQPGAVAQPGAVVQPMAQAAAVPAVQQPFQLLIDQLPQDLREMGTQLFGDEEKLTQLLSLSHVVSINYAGIPMQIMMAHNDDAISRYGPGLENGEEYGLDTLGQDNSLGLKMLNMIDFGANLGVVSIAVYKKHPGLVRAVVVEPAPTTFFYLAVNMWLNQIPPLTGGPGTQAAGIAGLQKAVTSDPNFKMTMCIPGHDVMTGSMNAHIIHSPAECDCEGRDLCSSVSGAGVDELFAYFGEEPLSFVKMDCEACEMEALPAMDKYSFRVKRFAGEMHMMPPSIVDIACKYNNGDYLTGMCEAGGNRHISGMQLCEKCSSGMIDLEEDQEDELYEFESGRKHHSKKHSSKHSLKHSSAHTKSDYELENGDDLSDEDAFENFSGGKAKKTEAEYEDEDEDEAYGSKAPMRKSSSLHKKSASHGSTTSHKSSASHKSSSSDKSSASHKSSSFKKSSTDYEETSPLTAFANSVFGTSSTDEKASASKASASKSSQLLTNSESKTSSVSSKSPKDSDSSELKYEHLPEKLQELGVKLFGTKARLESVLRKSQVIPVSFADLDLKLAMAENDDAATRFGPGADNGEEYGLDTIMKKGESSGMLNLIDLGANLGTVTIALFKKYPKKVRAVSVEPLPTTYFYFIVNLWLNDVPRLETGDDFTNAGVVAVQKAISRKPGATMEMCIPGHEGKSGSMNAFFVTEKKRCSCSEDGGDDICSTATSVNLATIFQTFGDEEIHMLKMDCEGCEEEALPALEEGTLKKRVRRLAGEVHMMPPQIYDLVCQYNKGVYLTGMCKNKWPDRLYGKDLCAGCSSR